MQSATSTNELPSVVAPCSPRRHRWSALRVSLRISLVLHTCAVLFLLRLAHVASMYPPAAVEIVARDVAPRELMTLSFTARPAANVDSPIESPALPARVVSTSLQPRTLAQQPEGPFHLPPSHGRRVTLAATLPAASIVVPRPEAVSVPIDPMPTSSIPLPSTPAPPAAVRDFPSSFVATPNLGPPEQRPLGLANLPGTRERIRHRQPTAAFAQRHTTARIPRENRPAIERGLDYLARVQLDDGRWRFDDLRSAANPSGEPASLRTDAAATGLALLAFFGAGQDHFAGRYRGVIDDGVRFLVGIQHDSGQFFQDDSNSPGQFSSFYSHGIATLAVCEAYGMTSDPALREPAQRALDYLAQSQRVEAAAPSAADVAAPQLAVIGWQFAAVRSGQLAGLHVDVSVLERLQSQLTAAAAVEPQSDAVATAVDMAVQLHLGSSPNQARFHSAADQLLAHPPELGEQPPAAAVQRDAYYWYYGSEAMYYLGGADWQAWSAQLYPPLVQSQVRDGAHAGSWSPARDEMSSASAGGRFYATAMNLLSLEVQNRHLTPPATAHRAAADDSRLPAR